MTELLTAKDVEMKIFKKASFGGYSIPDVEEFLNQIAEDLEAYAARQGELQRKIYDLEEAVKRHEAMKDTIKDALILAQKSAKDKEDEAKHHAELILDKARAQLDEIELEARRRREEVEGEADEIVAAARVEASRVLSEAEDLQKEARKRLDNLDAEIAKRMAEANDRASDITAAARLEARRVTSKVKHEIEESKRELSALQIERHRFLRDTVHLVASFSQIIEEAGRKIEKGVPPPEHDAAPKKQDAGRMTLSFSPIIDDQEDEVAIS
ncbi:MAG: DivIVA domain-containing protein [Synergistaceae bacterium]|jgi:cell division initiation protein|nr:DivIVA domain-containing protein [Synergistaceae bacterium]